MREMYKIGPGRIVTVTIEASDATGERLYTAREVEDLRASEAELVSAPLRRRVTELETELAQRPTELDWAAVRAERDAANQRAVRLERLLAGAEGRVQALETKVRNYDQDRHSERDRAESNREWAERAEARLARMAEEKREAIERMADQLGKVISAVHGYEVSQALQRTHYESAWEYQIMAGAIRNVRRVVGPPTPPATPAGPEAQA